VWGDHKKLKLQKIKFCEQIDSCGRTRASASEPFVLELAAARPAAALFLLSSDRFAARAALGVREDYRRRKQ